MDINLQQQKSNQLVSYVIQAVLLVICLVIVAGLFNVALFNYSENSSMSGLPYGFDFLRDLAGFDVLFSITDLEQTDSYLSVILASINNTFFLCSVVLAIALPIAMIIAILYLYAHPDIKRILKNILSCIESLPLPPLLFTFYFSGLVFFPKRLAAENGFFGIGLISLSGWQLPNIDMISIIYIVCVCVSLLMLVCLFTASRNGGRSALAIPIIFIVVSLVGLQFMFVAQRAVTTDGNMTGGVTIPLEFLVMSLLLIIFVSSLLAKSLVLGIDHAVQANPNNKTNSLTNLGEGTVLSASALITNIISILKYTILSTFIAYPEFFSVTMGTILNQTGAVHQIVIITLLFYSGIYLFFNGLNSVLQHFVICKRFTEIPVFPARKNNLFSWIHPALIVFSILASFGIWFLLSPLWDIEIPVDQVFGFKNTTEILTTLIVGVVLLTIIFWNKQMSRQFYSVAALVFVYWLAPILASFIDFSSYIQGWLLNWSITIYALLFSLPLGFALGAGAASNWLYIAVFCKGLIALFRSIPMMALLFIMSIFIPLIFSYDNSVDKIFRILWVYIIYATVMIASCFAVEYRHVLGKRNWQVSDVPVMDIIEHYFYGFGEAILRVKPALIRILVRLLLLSTLVIGIGLMDITSVIYNLSLSSAMDSGRNSTLLLFIIALVSVTLPVITFTLYANYLESRQEQANGIVLNRRRALSHFLH